VLWLLGANQYLRLIINRYRADGNRAKYLQLMKLIASQAAVLIYSSRFREKIDALIDQVNPEDEADVDHTVSEIKCSVCSLPLDVERIQNLLNGKNHLPGNETAFQSAEPSYRFHGSGEYREHFFGDKSCGIVEESHRDQLRYSVPALDRGRKTQARLAWQSPFPRRGRG
jgi:hypothetical protein